MKQAPTGMFQRMSLQLGQVVECQAADVTGECTVLTVGPQVVLVVGLGGKALLAGLAVVRLLLSIAVSVVRHLAASREALLAYSTFVCFFPSIWQTNKNKIYICFFIVFDCD